MLDIAAALTEISSQHTECIGLALATAEQGADGFLGPCIFFEWEGDRYRIDLQSADGLSNEAAIVATAGALAPATYTTP
ncbi:MAG: hypothetical protein AAFV72_00200 [Cyanobacteria bacterium J06635_1]